MAAIEVSTTIPAERTRVWAELERVEDHSEWMADAVSIEFADEQRRGVGTRIAVDTRIGPFTTVDLMEFVRWDPPLAMGVSHEGVVSGSGEFTLTADGDTTTITWREDLRFPWFLAGPIGAWIARPVLRRFWRKNLEALASRI